MGGGSLQAARTQHKTETVMIRRGIGKIPYLLIRWRCDIVASLARIHFIL
jgi:hypothetical protein